MRGESSNYKELVSQVFARLRYQQGQGHWVVAALESRELLTLCLKKIKSLPAVTLIDASFIWTEPHSRRIKVKLTIQKEVDGGAVLQQTFVVEYVVNRNMCEACHRIEAKDFWTAMTQVRQKVPHKKTFFYLEQLLLKHKANTKCTNIKSVTGGLDFFFDKKDDARKLADFLVTVVPCRYITSERLISQDFSSNTYNYKNTFSVEIVPICKDDVVCLPKQLAAQMGSISQLCLCLRVTQQIYLIDPRTLKTCEVNAMNYFKYPFHAIAGTKQLVSFTVMDVEVKNDTSSRNHGRFSEKHVLADVWVVKTSELGVNESYVHCRTHLGHLLHCGDQVLGYDLKNSNFNDSNFDKFIEKHEDQGTDVILVKKIFGEKAERKANRKWKLRRLQIDGESMNEEARDFDDFADDIEEDPMSRAGINIYKDPAKISNAMAVDRDEQDDLTPKITLQEMLEDLAIDDE